MTEALTVGTLTAEHIDRHITVDVVTGRLLRIKHLGVGFSSVLITDGDDIRDHRYEHDTPCLIS